MYLVQPNEMLHHPSTHITGTTTPIPLSFPAGVAAQRLPRRLPSLSRRSCRLASSSTNGGKGMSGFHEMELRVREYELDQFGVVNNAVYAHYSETVMYQIFYMIGFGEDSIVTLREASYKYFAPLKKNQKFLIKGRVYDYSFCQLHLENFIFRLPNLEPILECKATAVILDKSQHPFRIPKFVMANIDRL